MKKCKSCQKEIDLKAKKCPYCQTDLRSWFAKHPIIVIFLVIIIIVIGSTAGKKEGKNNLDIKTDVVNSETNTTATQSEITPTTPPQVVDAVSLVAEFDKNKLSAQEKYTNKIVQLSAYIKNISGGDYGDYYLSLEPVKKEYYFGTTIQAYFKDKKALTSLENGQKVTIIGTLQDMSLGIIQVKDCNIIK